MNRQEQGLHAVAAGDDGGSGSKRRPEDDKKQDPRGLKDPKGQKDPKGRILENPIDVEPKDPNPPASPTGG